MLIGVAAVGILALCFFKQWRLAAVWLLVVALGLVLNQAAKAVIERQRPGGDFRPAVAERSLSFPSGHAMGATIGYGMVGFVGIMLLRRAGSEWR